MHSRRLFRSAQVVKASRSAGQIRTRSTQYAPPLNIDVPHTHEVFNQVPPLFGVNHFDSDKALQEAVRNFGGQWAESHLQDFGALTGTEMLFNLAQQANKNRPQLKTHDRLGHRIDAVDYHPAYHELMKTGIEWQLPSFSWRHKDTLGAQVARSALHFLWCQLEQGVSCPLTMTFAAVPALQHQPEIAKAWIPKLLSEQYDHRDLPMEQKSGCTVGMSMTEKQGGSDVRANTTSARPYNTEHRGPGQGYLLRGHKWFTSAPMSDGFLTLAHTGEGGSVSCFLVPRFLPDGTRNRGLNFQRLKDKLGDHSNASSEVEYNNAWGVMIGKEGRGVNTIIEMVSHTRLDCAVGSAGIMRQAVAQASHHASHRSAFGAKLREHPLMANVLVDLGVEVEAATLLAMRVAKSFDDSIRSPEEAPLCRIITAIAKYWICKLTPSVVYEAMECHGGNGYVEDSILPRLYRQAPLNSIWEGSGNVICLDVLRTMKKYPDVGEALLREISHARGTEPTFDSYLGNLQRLLQESIKEPERNARRVVDALALALEASLLLRYGHPEVAQAFIRSRLGDSTGYHYGTLPSGVNLKALIERQTPQGQQT